MHTATHSSTHLYRCLPSGSKWLPQPASLSSQKKRRKKGKWKKGKKKHKSSLKNSSWTSCGNAALTSQLSGGRGRRISVSSRLALKGYKASSRKTRAVSQRNHVSKQNKTKETSKQTNSNAKIEKKKISQAIPDCHIHHINDSVWILVGVDFIRIIPEDSCW